MTPRPRASSFLRAPSSLRGYPRLRLAKGQVVFRSHHKDNKPGYFASTPANPAEGGRFDLPAPNGTCYTAFSAAVALRERIGPELHEAGAIPLSVLEDMKISQLQLPRTVTAANTASSEASNFHTLELVTTCDYALTQRWASAFHRAGNGGVVYQARFSTQDRAGALALFGAAGPVAWEAQREEAVLAVAHAAGVKVATRRPNRDAFAKAPPVPRGRDARAASWRRRMGPYDKGARGGS